MPLIITPVNESQNEGILSTRQRTKKKEPWSTTLTSPTLETEKYISGHGLIRCGQSVLT
jgi:hypothetical protein